MLAALPCSVTLPAGAGKTELIAASVAEVARRGGTSLVLTHTHAGVDALRRRVRKFGVASDHVVIRTIDAWSYDLIAHFPDLSGLAVPTAPDWGKSEEYHRAATRASRSLAVVRMLQVSYTNLFVDEYQDCLLDQHQLVLAMASAVPAAVFGDPLQCLFNFKLNQPVDWTSDVLLNFPPAVIEHRPRRWDPDHQDLGKWLVDIRANLLSGEPIDLGSTPAKWVHRRDARTYVGVCFGAANLVGTVAVLGNRRWDCVGAAGNLGGRFTVMEAIDEKTVAVLASRIDTHDGAAVAQAIVKFAVDCSSGLAPHISVAKRKQLGDGKSFATRSAVLKPAYDAVLEVRRDPAPASVRIALDLLSRLPGVTIHCREAWNEINGSTGVAATDGCTMSEGLQRVRNHSRVAGRRPTNKVVSRPLLVKGLEYDHVIILAAETYSAQELYVALTRGSKSVTIISDTSVLPPAKMAVRNATGDGLQE
ncbi:AAA family ATPase [Rhodococcus sp. BP-252]|nr:AAA family ATPase [Rhodococcus sp. BP-320]MBY6419136.1 AAA family ATPase [Rhodococcus sp. BP-321]MBY6423980.1 AAA family ATPase [Rhodococcus sp. BP-324]MBY6429309.1 AAA family ATPase [Rhodococcus sp. BP-323]MBY6434270.1 AAA family ATPase [Rhodococcus sp. BP-322]MBY6443162.1 AAA family ATPase [Rhodococcus sp. BP-319]MBY6447960.1 AAA family ATPase [Rhodococcus sp. BP-318]MBY6452868.1 AAA family ATPase [Rhodococcus sp. BP-315]MBY6457465.1 AAA family ATPase [Rhodococcus sp. BP-277]MBY646263